MAHGGVMNIQNVYVGSNEWYRLTEHTTRRCGYCGFNGNRLVSFDSDCRERHWLCTSSDCRGFSFNGRSESIPAGYLAVWDMVEL